MSRNRLIQSLLRPGHRITISPRQSLNSISSSLRYNSGAAWPLVPTCPSPSCTCNPPAMPSLPDSLEIDYSRKLLGSMPLYFRHLVVHTGREDWTSKIEDEPGFTIAKDIRDWLRSPEGLKSPGPIVTSYSSAKPAQNMREGTVKITVFPEGKSYHNVPSTPEGVAKFMEKATGPLSYAEGRPLTILICGHGGRDARCGILGPILRDEFSKALASRGFEVTDQPPRANPEEKNEVVSLVSHVGGHALAGNVIIYWPGSLKVPGDADVHEYPAGIWYGRVEPKHVSGILEALLDEGKLVKDLLRGYFVTTTKAGELSSGKLDHVYRLTEPSLDQ